MDGEGERKRARECVNVRRKGGGFSEEGETAKKREGVSAEKKEHQRQFCLVTEWAPRVAQQSPSLDPLSAATDTSCSMRGLRRTTRGERWSQSAEPRRVEKKNSPAARTTTETLRDGTAASTARRGAATAARLEGEATHGAVERVIIIAENDILVIVESRGREEEEEE